MQPWEQLTRHALELLAAYGFGAAIATKSDLICRDIDVLHEIHATAPVLCKLTVTTADDALARAIEPHAPPPSARLDALARLSDAGLPTCILLMPVLPWLTDTEENIRTLVRRAGGATSPAATSAASAADSFRFSDMRKAHKNPLLQFVQNRLCGFGLPAVTPPTAAPPQGL